MYNVQMFQKIKRHDSPTDYDGVLFWFKHQTFAKILLTKIE